jgi:transcriptional regulator GlxA family with amidase domain
MRTIAVLLYDGMRIFDFSVITEVWGIDRTTMGVPDFTLMLCSERRRTVSTDFGARVRATHSLAAVEGADLVVVPGMVIPGEQLPPAPLGAISRAHARGAAVAALCGGAFVLGQAGLLHGRRATTHWLFADRFQEDFPDALFEQDSLFVRDGRVWTSAGTAAGIDLCLHLVREACGAEVASTIARRMVTPPHRAGKQRQYIQQAMPVRDSRDPLLVTIEWARGRLSSDLTVRQLATHAHMSERTFTRRFTELTGTTPLRWIHHERVQLAQRLLETTDMSVEAVAQHGGFGTTLTLRRHFREVVGTTPTAYREAFAASGNNQ